jgi:hypothetical protein
MPDGTPYTPEMKAQALVLVRDGMSHARVAQELALKYPERSPAARSIDIWCAQDADLAGLAQERMRDLWADQIALNDLLFERAQSEAPHLKGSAAVIGAAVGMDKEIRIIEALTGPKMPLNAQHITINFISKERPIIEGEVVE